MMTAPAREGARAPVEEKGIFGDCAQSLVSHLGSNRTGRGTWRSHCARESGAIQGPPGCPRGLPSCDLRQPDPGRAEGREACSLAGRQAVKLGARSLP
ncbi:hypothetical protein Y1Q_0005839 [Alligator mississippiensis]|uniref:Uncharacterized protein n=1 Tax=Alligator mississippiensis TaxID=8496 RepID=A0A151MG32_ALLMI|nr:hypothetical protein Y1Q_0005839 [Alligator mississippiensis]